MYHDVVMLTLWLCLGGMFISYRFLQLFCFHDIMHVLSHDECDMVYVCVCTVPEKVSNFSL